MRDLLQFNVTYVRILEKYKSANTIRTEVKKRNKIKGENTFRMAKYGENLKDTSKKI